MRRSRRDETRPLELVGLSLVLALFTGLVVLFATRQIVLALIFLGVAFIMSILGLAMLSLTSGPVDAPDTDTNTDGNMGAKTGTDIDSAARDGTRTRGPGDASGPIG